jgi:hypothetical protein
VLLASTFALPVICVATGPNYQVHSLLGVTNYTSQFGLGTVVLSDANCEISSLMQTVKDCDALHGGLQTKYARNQGVRNLHHEMFRMPTAASSLEINASSCLKQWGGRRDSRIAHHFFGGGSVRCRKRFMSTSSHTLWLTQSTFNEWGPQLQQQNTRSMRYSAPRAD